MNEPLTELELAVLAIGRRWPGPCWQREDAALELGLRPARFAQILLQLADDPRALVVDAATVRRLQRIREQARRRRAA